MDKYSKVVYNPELSIAENASTNNISQEEMRYYIRSRGIDRRNDERQPYINKIREYLKEHPTASRKQTANAIGMGINTVRRYWDIALDHKKIKGNRKKASIRKNREQRTIDFLNTIPLEFLKNYIAKREKSAAIDRASMAPILTSSKTIQSKALIIDFDMTLFNTRIGMEARAAKDWEKVYNLIPEYRLYDGWRDVLHWCKDNNVKVGIVSGAKKELIIRTIKHFNIDVDCVIGYQLYIQKPNPKLVIQALKKLGGVSTENVISIGDHIKDKQMAENSGVKFIGAVWDCEHPMHLDELKRGETISNPVEVIKLLKGMG